MGSIPPGKIHVPRQQSGLVARPGLRADLEAGTDSAVGIVCAPAGYGKTLLLAEWARDTTGATREDVAWVGLDRDDDDPRRLWAAVVAALVACPSVPDGSRLRALRPWCPDAQPEFLAELLDGVSRLPAPVRLVLDDLHTVTDPETLRGVGILVRNRPPQLRLVLSSRFDPPVPFALPRLRLTEQVIELRSERLRFSTAEASRLLALAGLDLTAEQVDVLCRRTGGWAAGLRLAALALGETTDVDGFLERFSGDERSVADYLAGEVLARMPEDLREFLRVASISRPIPAALAAELSGRKDAGNLLHELEHRTSLVRSTSGMSRQAGGHGPGTSTDADTYRIQELLRTHLAADLLRHGRRRAASLHVRAARWWVEHDRPIEALEHAALGADPRLTADLLHRFAVRLFLTGEHCVLRRSLSTLHPDCVAGDAWLALASALAHLGAGEVDEAHGDLQSARRHRPSDDAELLLVRTAAEQLGAGLTGGARPDGGPDETGAGVALQPPGPELLTGSALEGLVRLGRGTQALVVRRDRKNARIELEAALALGRRHGFDYLAMQSLALLGVIASTEGDLPAMSAIGVETTAAVAEHGWECSPWSAAASTMLAYVALHRCRPGEALELAARGLAEAGSERWIEESGPGGEKAPLRALVAALQTVRGAAEFDEGDRAGGVARMHRARSDLGELDVGPEQAASGAVIEFRAALELGHAVAARTVQGWLAARTSDNAELVLMRVWTEAAAGRMGQARALLAPLLAGDVPALLQHSPVEAWLMEAAAAVTVGERPAARTAVQTALALAEPLEALRPFAHADAGVRDLLAHHQGSFGSANAFAERALAVGADSHRRRLSALSDREHTVLELMPSLLSLDEIAADLGVSVNTVKSHARSIYTKLEVGSRRMAVLVAHEQGLLTGSVG